MYFSSILSTQIILCWEKITLLSICALQWFVVLIFCPVKNTFLMLLHFILCVVPECLTVFEVFILTILRWKGKVKIDHLWGFYKRQWKILRLNLGSLIFKSLLNEISFQILWRLTLTIKYSLVQPLCCLNFFSCLLLFPIGRNNVIT